MSLTEKEKERLAKMILEVSDNLTYYNFILLFQEFAAQAIEGKVFIREEYLAWLTELNKDKLVPLVDGVLGMLYMLTEEYQLALIHFLQAKEAFPENYHDIWKLQIETAKAMAWAQGKLDQVSH